MQSLTHVTLTKEIVCEVVGAVVDCVVVERVDDVSDVLSDEFESLDGVLAIVVVVNMSG